MPELGKGGVSCKGKVYDSRQTLVPLAGVFGIVSHALVTESLHKRFTQCVEISGQVFAEFRQVHVECGLVAVAGHVSQEGGDVLFQ